MLNAIVIASLAAGGILLLLGVRASYNSKKTYAYGEQVNGIVGRVNTTGIKPMQHYGATITYKVKGKKYKSYVQTGAFTPMIEGHKILITYKEEKPDEAFAVIEDYRRSYWICAAIFIVIGTLIKAIIG